MKFKLISIYLVTLLVINIGVTLFFQFYPMRSNIDANLKELDHYLKEQKYSGNILVAHKGEVIFEKGFGFQNHEKAIENTNETAFLLGSITKQFTAAAILKLQEQQKLALTDKIATFLPDYPNGDQITIHQLLTHTSGLPEYLDHIKSDSQIGKAWTTDQIVAAMLDKPAKSEPGSKFEYNNYGYVMLGAIIEAVTGGKYENYIKNHLLKPIGMDQTDFGYNAVKQSEQAVGYLNAEYKVAPYVDPSFAHAGGALTSTIGDLYKWDRALAGNKLLSEESKELMFQSYTSDSLLPNQAYGYGHYIVSEGEKSYHPGFIHGFSSNIYRDTTNDFLIIALSNMDSSFLPVIPAFLHDFSEQLDTSYIGYLTGAVLYLLMGWNVYILVKWLKGLQARKNVIGSGRWYRIIFQTGFLQLLALALLVVPFLPGLSLDLLSSQRLLLVAAPFWGTVVNLVMNLFVLFSIAAIQPFIRKVDAQKALVKKEI